MRESSECEVCGSAQARFLASIEGARLRVCSECAKSGSILGSLQAPQKQAPRQPQSASPAFELAPDFAERIRSARLKARLPLSVIAERTSEKESYLDRIERGETTPAEKTVKKLEKELGIILFEQASAGSSRPSAQPGFAGPTLGDLVIVKKKKG